VQIQAGAPTFGAQVPKPKPLPANQVVAHIGSEEITVARLRELLTGAPPAALQSVQRDPAEFLTWNSMMRKLSADALKDGLDKQSPYSDRLKWSSAQVLMMGRIEQKQREYTPPDEEASGWYRQNAHLFGTAKVRLIYIAADEGQQTAAKTKADGIMTQLAAGEDFTRLVQQFSDDRGSAAKGGQFADIGPDSKLPVDVRAIIFQTKPGAFAGPFHQPGGYYIFQIGSIDLKPFTEVRDSVINRLREQRSAQWLEEERKKTDAKIVNEAFFARLRASALVGIVEAAGNASSDVKPDTVLATINARPLTAEEYLGVFKAIPPNIRNNAVIQPKEFLAQYALMDRLANDARAAGVHQGQPYKGRLEYNRGEILMQAYVDQKLNSISAMPDEQKKAYESQRERFRWVRVKLLYVSYSVSPPPRTDPKAPKILSEDEARAVIEKIAGQARDGEDFVRLVRLHSEHQDSRAKDGDVPVMRADDGNLPAEVRQLVFAAQKGDLIGPVKLANGFYLFRVQELGERLYEEVKDQVYDELRQERFQKWFDGVRNSFQIRVDDPIAFRQVLAE
jgi:parvulin-like peptidyl-prolyl isomerase